MLRANARQFIIDTIENSYFGAANFIVQFGDATPSLFDISFIPDRRFEFSLSFAPQSDPHNYRSKEAPGESFLTPQFFSFNDINVANQRLTKWLDRVREELIAINPFAREISELRAQVEQQINRMDQNLDEFFTAQEAQSLKDRLDDLTAKLATLQQANEAMEIDISSLSQTVEDLKSASNLVNKGTWYRMANGRLLSGLKALAKSKEARELALEAAKKFLLEAPK